MDIARDDKLLENDICNVKLENETTFAFNSENEDSKAGSVRRKPYKFCVSF